MQIMSQCGGEVVEGQTNFHEETLENAQLRHFAQCSTCMVKVHHKCLRDRTHDEIRNHILITYMDLLLHVKINICINSAQKSVQKKKKSIYP